MSNEIIVIIEILSVLFALILSIRLFEKFSIITWVSVVMLIINLIGASTIKIFGINVLSGAVIFTTLFITVHMIREYYGVNLARNAIATSFGTNVLFLIIKYITLWYAPSDECLKVIFNNNIKLDILTALIFLVTNIANAFIYSKIEIRTKGKRLWLRYIISTIICSLIGTLAFICIWFKNTYTVGNMLATLGVTFIIEVITILCGLLALNYGKKMLKKLVFKKQKLF